MRSTLAVTGLSAPVVSAALYNTVIQTKYGSIQGYPAFNSSPAANLSNWQDITVWKGIPFAATTAYENRFKPPQPAAAWNSTLDAKDFGDTCPAGFSGTGISEDCLNVNVWSAANSTDAKLPVALWSYPAGGSDAQGQFDGAGMADKGVVFVNYNYRTSTFGNLVTPELTAENYARTGSNSSGNWGMLDQFAALQWVHENIAAFGGDPDHITVMGQSAGSAATYHMLNSPLHGVKLHGAIIESGIRDPHDPLCTSLAENYRTLEENTETGIEYTTSINCTSLECLRSVPMETLNPAPQGMGSSGSSYSFSATLDYYAMPDTYLNTLVKGIAQDVPVLTGNARDENGATYGLNITLDEYYTEMNETFGNWTAAFEEAYPANDSSSASTSYNAQWTDRSKVGTYFWAQLWYSNATSPVFNYLWDHAPPGTTTGAAHESEINYALNNLYDTDLPWEAEDYVIADTLNAYWVNFIKTGNPNGEGLVSWDATNSTAKNVMEVGDGWGLMPIAHDYQTELFSKWFATLVAY